MEPPLADDLSSAMRNMWEIYCEQAKAQQDENEDTGFDDDERVTDGEENSRASSSGGRAARRVAVFLFRAGRRYSF